MEKQEKNILWFSELVNKDVSLVGGKNASLGEMYSTLSEKGVRVPNGFVITAKAYRDFVKETGLTKIIEDTLKGLDVSDIKELQSRGEKIRKAFLKVDLSKDLSIEITEAYKKLSEEYKVKDVDVAVRSSATAEDLPGASFAGEHETYLNVSGSERVIMATKKAMASLFNDRAISYRVDKGFGHFDVALSVGVQKMVRSDKASSGVMFTLDTETGFRDVVRVSSSLGLGEMVVQGEVNPDEFIVFKPTLAQGFSSLIKKSLGSKEVKMIYADKESTGLFSFLSSNNKTKTSQVKKIETTKEERNNFSLTDQEVLSLAKWGVMIEEHYSKLAGKEMPMDMEWAKDGVSGDLFIVQARPETIHSEKKGFEITRYVMKDKANPIVEGAAIGIKIISGKARVIKDLKNLNDFQKGEILIAEITTPDWEPIMKIASAIVTERGGRTSHAAIVSRELGVPAVVGIGDMGDRIKTGDILTIDCSSGSVGKIYEGKLVWTEETHKLDEIPKTKTKITLNIGNPDEAFANASLPHQGVGLAREEFIIASHIGIHPLAILDFEKQPIDVQTKIEERTRGYESKKEFYIGKLAEGVSQIAAAFWPHQVIVRFSDFKTNEYATLIGGASFEPKEENPMLGWRGASRYVTPEFSPAFKLECMAIKKARDEFGLKNVAVMVPFCRTPEEGQKVVDLMESFGLKKGENDLKIMVMCEIPSNIILADKFLDIFDGFSIGSNDLTQLVLGLDRDNAVISGITNENNEAVKNLIAGVIKKCNERGKYIGICGQAPSDYPEFLRFLIDEGIGAISLNPDSIIPMIFETAKQETKNGNK